MFIVIVVGFDLNMSISPQIIGNQTTPVQIKENCPHNLQLPSSKTA